MATGNSPEVCWQARRQRTPAPLTAPDPQAPAASNDTYVLGNDAAELDRLRLQHDLWRPILLAALGRAGLSPGERVIDLGPSPGFVAEDLARIVGPDGLVVGLEQNPAYVRHGQQLAWRLAWASWTCVAMTCSAIPPARRQLRPGLVPLAGDVPAGGRTPAGSMAQQPDQWRPGDSRSRICAAGAGPGGCMAGRWLEMFVTLYGSRLQVLGLWSPDDAEGARAEMAASRADPGSFWVGPTILEVRARRT